MFGRKPMPTFLPSDVQAKEKLNLYIYEYLYHIGAVKAAQGLCADMKWEPSKVALGEAPGFLLGWWCVFWDLYNAAPERRDQHLHSEEAEAFYHYGLMNSNVPADPNVSFHPPPAQPPMVPQFPRFPPPTTRLPSSRPTQLELRQNSPVPRLFAHAAALPPNVYRRIHSNNSPVDRRPNSLSSPQPPMPIYHDLNFPPNQNDRPAFPFADDSLSDATAIQRLKESIEEEVKKFHLISTNSSDDDFPPH